MHHASPAIFSVGHLTCCWAKRWLRPHTQLKSMRPRHHTNSFRNGTFHQQNRETWLEYLGIYQVYWNRCSQLIPIQNCPKYFPDFCWTSPHSGPSRGGTCRHWEAPEGGHRSPDADCESHRGNGVLPWGKKCYFIGKMMRNHWLNHISIILWWMMNYGNLIIIYIIHQPNNNTILGYLAYWQVFKWRRSDVLLSLPRYVHIIYHCVDTIHNTS